MKRSQKFCVYDVLLNWHIIGLCPSSCFAAAQHLGNSLQNMFYRQCPVFSICISYITLWIFDLNFWSHLWSLTANQDCRMCGVEKDNLYRTIKTIYTKWKLGGRFYAAMHVLTLANSPSSSWAVKQQVWYSNVWRTVIVEFNTNISESMFGKFSNQRPVFIPGMCTVPFNQAIKCQGALPWDESYVTAVQCWTSVGRQTKKLQIVNVRKGAWCCALQPLVPTRWIISYHWPKKCEMNFHSLKTHSLIFRIGCYAWVHKSSCLLFETVWFIEGKTKAIPGYAMKAYWWEEVQLHTLTSALSEGK